MKLCCSSPSKLDASEASAPATPLCSGSGSGGKYAALAFSTFYSRNSAYSALFPMTAGKEICKRIFVVAVMKNVIIPSARKGYAWARVLWARTSVALSQFKVASYQVKRRMVGYLLAIPLIGAAIILWLPLLTLGLVITSPLWVTLAATYCVIRQICSRKLIKNLTA